ncbi:MAG: ABC transporter ATP-binding protein [Firmicutes bacterium]|nr:ABC transporter ATP-binding protein [Bacillota bacterium]
MNRGPQRVNEQSKDFFGALKRLFSELKSFRVAIYFALLVAASSSILAIISPNRLSELTDEISYGLVVKKDNIETITNNIQNNLNNLDVNKIMTSDLNDSDKQLFMSTISTNSEALLTLPENILVYVLPTFNIDNVDITTSDQIKYLSVLSSVDANSDVKELYSKIEELPESIRDVIKPSMNMDKIIKIVIFLICLYLLSAVLSLLQSYIMAIVSNKFAFKLRDNISKKINKLPLKFFDKNQVGDTLSRVTNDVDTIAQSMNQSLTVLVSSITLFVGTIIMMFYTNWIMALTAILSSLIGFVFMGFILSRSQKYFKARQKELGKLNSHIEEVYSGLLVVKAYNGKKDSDIKFDDLNKKVYDANRKSQFLAGLMPSTMMFIGNFGYVAVCIVGALLTHNNVITFGVIVAFMTYVRLFTNPLNQMAQAFISLQSTAAASERVFEFMDEEEMKKENVKTKLDKTKVKGNIEFDHVKFGYDEDKTIIKDFTAKVRAGQKVAIVGPTGAGKTTMVNLLMKFYDINSGDIKIDGVSIKDLSRDNIHDLFTMVLQDTWLFNGTIKDNIKYNRENVSDAEVRKVCDVVGLTHYIKTLPNTYDSMIDENDSVSSGQKQLLTIARGMIESAPFLILDEATSNVDTRTEELVQKAMDRLMDGRTSFIIAHRLSTIKNADLILVMKDGNIIEQGTHRNLLKQNGFYADLYNSQFTK